MFVCLFWGLGTVAFMHAHLSESILINFSYDIMRWCCHPGFCEELLFQGLLDVPQNAYHEIPRVYVYQECPLTTRSYLDFAK